MKLKAERNSGLGQRMGRVIGGFALVTAALTAILDPELRGPALVNTAALLGYVALERVAAHMWPDRPVSFVRVLLLIQPIQCISLVLVIFSDGDLRYSTATGHYSLADGAGLVAFAGVALSAALVFGAKLAGVRGPAARLTWHDTVSHFSSSFFSAASSIVLVMLVGRMALLFLLSGVAPPIAYGLRILLSYFLAMFFFVGVALRIGHRPAKVASLLTFAIAPLVVLSGSRADALVPVALVGLGYIVARPISGGRLIRLAAYASVIFVTAMFVGDAVRGDERGRTGEAALARVGELQAVVAEQSNVETVAVATLHRMISYSAHAVITRLPAEFPFEENGILKLPSEFVDKVLPRFNLSGISDSEMPRNWMLNDLGFMVNWATSVELSLTADAWFRGGVTGLLIVGLTLGLLLQLLENTIYARMQRTPALFVVLVFVMSSMPFVAGRDIVMAVRSTAFMVLAGLTVIGTTQVIDRRRSQHSPMRNSARTLVPGARS